MDAVFFARAILLILVAEYLLEVLADWLNRRRAVGGLPAELKDSIPEEDYLKARDYQMALSRLERRQASLALIALLVFWNLDGFARLDTWASGLFPHWLGRGLVYIGTLVLASRLLDLPASLYKTFVIDARFNMNNTTAATWIKDQFKMLALVLLLAGPLLAGVLALFHSLGAGAWVGVWLLVSLFGLAVAFVAPNWLMPLFNKFSPLPEGELRDRILAYAQRNHFPLKDILVMDGSRRSRKTNAFLSGFGSNRRIAFYDTLIDSQGPAELEAVMAHEVGHFKHRHIPVRLVLTVVTNGITFFLLGQFIGNPALAGALGLPQPSVHVGLVGFMMLYTPVALLLGLVHNAISRHHEYQADTWAARTIPDPEAMVHALKTLSRDNLAELDPHPLTVALHYNHPPVLDRIHNIRSLAPAGPM
jgi:STE24 endopeptidase